MGNHEFIELSEEEVIEIFEKAGVMKKGHFRLTSGRHSERYLQCAQLLQYPEYTSIVCKALAQKFKLDEVEVVIGPATGGIILAYEMARILGARSLFAEREDGKMKLRRNFQVYPGEKVLIIEDVVTTGGSVKEVVEIVKEQEGELVGVACLVNRSGGKADFGTRLESVLALEIETYDPESCPLCAQGIPVVKPGSRKV